MTLRALLMIISALAAVVAGGIGFFGFGHASDLTMARLICGVAVVVFLLLLFFGGNGRSVPPTRRNPM